MFAEAMGITVDDARGYIDMARGLGVEVEGDAVVGVALTLRPTANRFRVRGNDLYTWCGFDTLFLPILLAEHAQVASTCPVTGTPIQLTVHADGTASDVTPDTVVVGIVGEEIAAGCPVSGLESAICTQMPFFASRRAGELWLADHPGVAIVDLDEARDIACAYVEGPCGAPQCSDVTAVDDTFVPAVLGGVCAAALRQSRWGSVPAAVVRPRGHVGSMIVCCGWS